MFFPAVNSFGEVAIEPSILLIMASTLLLPQKISYLGEVFIGGWGKRKN